MSGQARKRAGSSVRMVLLLAMSFVAGCGDDSTGPDDSLSSFVGDWEATSLVLTSVADPSMSPDLIAIGGTFTLNVQPSGLYTAIFLYAGQNGTELGTISVAGNTITFHVTAPAPATYSSTFAFNGNTLVLDGDSSFDFDLDGTAEPAIAHFVLVPR